MKPITIAIGADHRGFQLKKIITECTSFSGYNITWIDCGADSDRQTDYPQYAIPVCEAIINKNADFGILLCGTGVGMTIVANRYSTIFAALCWNPEIAWRSKEEDNANVLVLPADYMSAESALECVGTWLEARFKEGHYRNRIKQIQSLKCP